MGEEKGTTREDVPSVAKLATEMGDATRADLPPPSPGALAAVVAHGLEGFSPSYLAHSAARLVVHPLEVGKIRLQTQPAATALGATAPMPLATDALLAAQLGLPVHLLLKHGVFAALRRHDGLPLLRNCSSRVRAALLRMLAAAVAMLATHPLELVRTRLVVQDAAAPVYDGVLHALATIARVEGPLALFSGAAIGMLGTIPWTIGSEAILHLVDRVWPGAREHKSRPVHFVVGSLASVLAQAMAYPFDTVRSRMHMTSDAFEYGLPSATYANSLDCFRRMWREEGPESLFAGFWTNQAKVLPFVLAFFLVLDGADRVLPADQATRKRLAKTVLLTSTVPCLAAVAYGTW